MSMTSTERTDLDKLFKEENETTTKNLDPLDFPISCYGSNMAGH